MMNAMQDLSLRSPDEIRNMSEELRREALSLGGQQKVCDKKIKESKEQLRTLIPNVIEITHVANKRTEALDKKRRLEKKILSIYNRFPGILNSDQPQIISTDIKILKRQLELIRERETNATQQIDELDRKLEHLQQRMVDINRQQRLQKELMNQRDQDKSNLARNLRTELDAAKTLYSSDGRGIERKLEENTRNMSQLQDEYNKYNTQFDTLKRQRVGLLSAAPSQNAQISAQISTKHVALLQQVDYYLNWWASRRNLRHYNDRIEFLDGVLQKTQERYEASYKSIEFIKRENASRVQELSSLKSMNVQLEKSITEARANRDKVSQQLETVKKSFRPLPDDIDHQLKSLKANLIACQNREKSLDVELQMYTDSSGSEGLLEKKFEDARRNYRNKLREVVVLQKSIEDLRKESDTTQKATASVHSSLASIQDPRVLLTEDQNPVLVQAGPIDSLVSLLFNPANNEAMYPKALLVLAHTLKPEFQQFINLLVRTYESTEFRSERELVLRGLIDAWRVWFPTDFIDPTIRNLIGPILNLVGGANIFEPPQQTPILFKYDINIPFNAKEERLILSAPPSIIAEHYSYIELQILLNIPASEFVGCGWTGHDKFNVAGHILKMMEHFNMVGQLIVYTIVTEENMNARANYLDLWIQVMNSAYELCNFQLVFEIFGALCSPALSNLKKTWEKISSSSKELYESYRRLTTPGNRFGNYREELQKNPVELTIPYIGPMLTQLVYISDGNPSKKTIPETGETVLNFSKHRMYSEVMDDIIKPWGKEMRFTLNEELVKRIRNHPPIEISDSDMFQRSQLLERDRD